MANNLPLKQKVRICHVIDGCTPNPLLYNSIKYADRSLFDFSVIALRSDEGLVDQMAEINVPTRSLDYRSRTDAPRVFVKLYSLFRSEKVAIVQTHLFDASLIGLSAARLARVPVTIFTGHHSHETPLHKRNLLTLIDGASGRFLANHVVAPSMQMKEIFIQDLKVPEQKIDVLHHGFDLEDWREQATGSNRIVQEFGLEGKTIFGAVGRLFWVKNFENLIRAFARITDTDRDSVLLIVGAGDQAELRLVIETSGLGDRVILTGPRKDIASVMNTFDVFLHPSLAESFGMVYIEAFALGKPIVTTPVGVAPEVIVEGENGYFFNGTDVESLAGGIRRIIGEKHRWDAMGANGKRVADRFEIRKTQKLCDELYLGWCEGKL